MVFSTKEKERDVTMGNGFGADEGEGERVKAPLHSFNFPSSLKWGYQRQLRCQKVPENGDGSSQREMVSSQESAMERMGMLKIDYGDDEGVDAMRERLTLDMKVEGRRIRDAIMKKDKENGVGSGGEGSSKAAAGEKAWNFRTRKGVPGDAGKGLKIDEKNPNISSPLKGGGSTEKKAMKFSLSLTKKEIEEDFIKMTGQMPPRRPKRRSKNVQKKMNALFPGVWLSEVNADSYKVPDALENGKICTSRRSIENGNWKACISSLWELQHLRI
ncbi:hypothetical protein MtrunA17_Chr6g0451821 [Medicago truncatula]|uniref:DUF1639 family protein n=1 Tax=Medicago truncatula TaxID=3880 RepID=A0A396HBB3_MEDTR|nr:hypothetical protein MtrunA17_Chr6g0451821 [Medicago truncatula]